MVMPVLPYQVEGGAAKAVYVINPAVPVVSPGQDPTEPYLVTISLEHELVHEGYLFEIEHSASVLNSGNLDIRFVPPGAGGLDLHAAFTVQAGGQCNIYLYESPTISVGTALPNINLNRKSALTLGWSFTHTPTVTSLVGATILINGRLLAGGTTPRTRIGGAVRQAEFIFDRTKDYLLRITNTSGSTVAVAAVMEVYERLVD